MAIRPRPVGPRVLVTKLEANEQTYSGIILPEDTRARERRGCIVAVGDGWFRALNDDVVEHTPLPLKVGETVIWEKGHGTHVTIDVNENGVSEDFVLLHINEVLLVLDEVLKESMARQGER
jgi:chaperonin GroES